MTVDVDKFVKDINEVKKESGRSTDEMLTYVMILMLQTGRSETKFGRKNRALVTDDSVSEEISFDHVSDDGPVASEPKRRFFKVYKQGSYIPRRIYVPAIPRKTKSNENERAEAMRARDAIVAKFKKIKYRGIARASWGWAMRLVSSKARLSDSETEIAGKAKSSVIDVNRHYSGLSPYLEVVNKLGWILRIAPNIEQRMMASADARLQKWLERRWQTGIDRAERRTA